MEPKNAEGRLRKNLFCDYDKDNRPILTDGPITIQFKMIIKGFMFADLDGKLTVSTWLAMVRSKQTTSFQTEIIKHSY